MWPNDEAPEQHQVIKVFRAPPPHDKDIEVGLLYLAVSDAYLVKSITNTTWYKPGDWLSADVAGKICAMPRWKVTAESYQLLAKALGLLGNFVHIP